MNYLLFSWNSSYCKTVLFQAQNMSIQHTPRLTRRIPFLLKRRQSFFSTLISNSLVKYWQNFADVLYGWPLLQLLVRQSSTCTKPFHHKKRKKKGANFVLLSLIFFHTYVISIFFNCKKCYELPCKNIC